MDEDKKRMVEVIGVPEHLRELGVLQALCKAFGRVEKLSVDAMQKHTVILTVEECNILKIPLMTPLWDDEVAFPISFQVTVATSQGQASRLQMKGNGQVLKKYNRPNWVEIVNCTCFEQRHTTHQG